MRHADRLARIGGQKSGVQADVANVAACYVQARQFFKTQVLCWRARAQSTTPNLDPLPLIGKRKMYDEANPAKESRIDGWLKIRSQDRQPSIGLHTLQQIGNLNMFKTVVAVADVRSLPEQRVGFVQQ